MVEVKWVATVACEEIFALGQTLLERGMDVCKQIHEYNEETE